MGSGHFLISAIDRIEKRMAGYLAERSLPGVSRGLADLRIAAAASLNSGTADKIEDGQLLRRQIARRCIYGIDLNQFSVQTSPAVSVDSTHSCRGFPYRSLITTLSTATR